MILSSQIICLFATKISRGNLLVSCEEKLTFNKLFIERAKGLTKILCNFERKKVQLFYCSNPVNQKQR